MQKHDENIDFEQFNHPDFSLSETQWQSAIDETRKLLIAAAKKRKIFNYKELADRVTTIDFNLPHLPFYRVLPHIIGQISVEEHQTGRPLLSVLVVNNETNVPGKGFYNLAKWLKFVFTDNDTFASDEIKKTFAYWRKQA
ncbi:MAG: hypothetical protein Q7R33_09580 [Nitrosarchaeum sp.]|nr:hypothetical protein [Nitrosarchaeum sp.]